MDRLISVEIYSIFIIFILNIDYYYMFKSRLNRNSYIFIITSSIILLISAINLIASFINPYSVLANILIIFQFIIAIIPPTLLHNYMNINFFNKSKYYKNQNILANYYCIVYWIVLAISIIYTIINNNKTLVNVNLYDNIKIILLFTLLPLIVVMIKWLFSSKGESVKFNLFFFIVTIIPIIAVPLDIIFEKLFLYSASYVLALLIIYISKKNSVIYTDTLTGLYNRHILDDSVLVDSLMKNQITALYLIDLDKFKHINDTYGHLTGDKTLQVVSNILKNSTRKTDYVIRIGGDEFLIIASINSKENINLIEEKIKSNLEKHNNKSKIKIGLSLGYEFFERKGINLDIEKYLEIIDKKMYKDKLNKQNIK